MTDELEEAETVVVQERERMVHFNLKVKQIEDTRRKQSAPLVERLNKLQQKRKMPKCCLSTKKKEQLDAQITEVQRELRCMVWDDGEELGPLIAERAAAESDLRVTEYDLQKVLLKRIKNVSKEIKNHQKVRGVQGKILDAFDSQNDQLAIKTEKLRYLCNADESIFKEKYRDAAARYRAHQAALKALCKDMETVNDKLRAANQLYTQWRRAAAESIKSIATRCTPKVSKPKHFLPGWTFKNTRNMYKAFLWDEARIGKARKEMARRNNPVEVLQDSIAAALPKTGGGGSKDFEVLTPTTKELM